MMTADPGLDAVVALRDGPRRVMYAFIRRTRRPVTRDEAAASAGISRKLAAFHLDKLVDAGLLRTRREAGGRAGKVGRAPNLVCGINHAYLTGMLTGLNAAGVRAILVPRAGECCVELRSATAT